MLPLLKETNNKNLKFRIGDNVGISKYKNIMPWTYAINDLHGEKVFGTFYETNCKKRIKKHLESKK